MSRRGPFPRRAGAVPWMGHSRSESVTGTRRAITRLLGSRFSIDGKRVSKVVFAKRYVDVADSADPFYWHRNRCLLTTGLSSDPVCVPLDIVDLFCVCSCAEDQRPPRRSPGVLLRLSPCCPLPRRCRDGPLISRSTERRFTAASRSIRTRPTSTHCRISAST